MTTITSHATGETVTILPTTVPTAATGSLAAQVREYKKANPKALPKEISKALGIPVARIYVINNYEKKRVQRLKAKKKAANAALENKIYALTQGRERLIAANKLANAQHADNVNHPAHYKVGGIETIDFIEAKQLNYNLGNVVKYITRADHKGNTSEDLLKARWYLNREIAKINKGAK
jgi:hypothetical protein